MEKNQIGFHPQKRLDWIRLFSLGFSVLFLALGSTASASAIFDTAAAACVARGKPNKNQSVTFVASGSGSCASACAALRPSAPPSCVYVWGVWPSKMFGYGSTQCSTALQNTTQDFKGSICCCETDQYPDPMQNPRAPYPY